VFHEAAAGGEVGDVVLVDLRGDHHEGPPEGLRPGGRVLEELEDLAAVDHLAGCDREVLADPEGPRVDHRRHPAVVRQVVAQVAQPGDQALTAGAPRPGERGGVAEERVGGCQRLGNERQGEADPLAALLVEAYVVDQAMEGRALHQVRLQQSAAEGVVGPGGVGEAAVGRVGRDLAAAEGDVQQLAGGGESVADEDAGLDGDPPEEPAESGSHLPAGEADKRVGSKDRRVVPVEYGGHVVTMGE